jgi:hypothetical protein
MSSGCENLGFYSRKNGARSKLAQTFRVISQSALIIWMQLLIEVLAPSSMNHHFSFYIFIFEPFPLFTFIFKNRQLTTLAGRWGDSRRYRVSVSFMRSNEGWKGMGVMFEGI